MATERDYAADCVRATALGTIILLHHLPSYLGGTPATILGINLAGFTHMTRYLGLGMFAMLSGRFLCAGGPGVTPLRFFARRLVRLMPLYWAALALYLVMFFWVRGRAFGGINLLAHLCGLQLLFGKPLFTLWYVGLIFIYYGIFAMILALDPLSRKRWGLFALSFCGLIGLKALLPTVDNRLILYWPIFAAGAYSAEHKIPARMTFFPALVGMACSAWFSFRMPPAESGAMNLNFWKAALSLNVFMFCSTEIAWRIASIVKAEWARKIAVSASYVSYFIYLFHTPLLQAVMVISRGTESFFLRLCIQIAALGALAGLALIIQPNADTLQERILRHITPQPANGAAVRI